MADLNDLKTFGESLIPIVQDVVQKLVNDQQKPDTSAEDAAILQLAKFVSEAGQQTEAALEGRAAAIVAMRTALTTILMKAATNEISLSDPQALIIQTQRNALRNAFGMLAERSAFDPIAVLLPPADVTKISGDLEQARQGIQAKKTAKDILDTVVTVAVVAAQIAVKVAAA
jgi:hypothetical protein